MSDISAFGITATLPSGWDGRISQRPGTDGAVPSAPEVETRAAPAPEAGADATTGTAPEAEPVPGDGTVNPVAHLANFPLPPARGDYGSGAVERMGSSDILVCLVEFDPEAAATPLFRRAGIPRFRLTDFSPDVMQRTIAGMCGAQAFFNESGRAFSAYVVLGSYRLRAPLVPPVNGVMSGLHIGPR